MLKLGVSRLERDKFLTKALGKCWHEWEDNPVAGIGLRCKNPECTYHKLDQSKTGTNILLMGLEGSFSTWDGFGRLKAWIDQQPWAPDFWYEFMGLDTVPLDNGPYPEHAMEAAKEMEPEALANYLYQSLKEGRSWLK